MNEADQTFSDFLFRNGYIVSRKLDDRVWIGVQPMLFTAGLFVRLTERGYSHRYCYEHIGEAVVACATWDGNGDPPGNWIKEKPSGRMNPNWAKAEA